VKRSAIVESCHAHTILAKTLKIEIGGDGAKALPSAMNAGISCAPGEPQDHPEIGSRSISRL
jgi:hypothetical protein